jgi:hypothetical protein
MLRARVCAAACARRARGFDCLSGDRAQTHVAPMAGLIWFGLVLWFDIVVWYCGLVCDLVLWVGLVWFGCLGQVVIEMNEPREGGDHFTKGKLNLVDLAGSERPSKTGATGARMKVRAVQTLPPPPSVATAPRAPRLALPACGPPFRFCPRNADGPSAAVPCRGCWVKRALHGCRVWL